MKAKLPIAANIFRSGTPFLDNRFVGREHMVEYEYVKEQDGESRLIWKLMGTAVTVDGQRQGVVQISRKRSAFMNRAPIHAGRSRTCWRRWPHAWAEPEGGRAFFDLWSMPG